ncbi:hypothetical protein M405DRAFT_755594 [Rhizopogon salebrosus TDB-379]|nr:hypothetical protein M405DRAFT_755594 [Rhizopogon salebrosus TDB-379]
MSHHRMQLNNYLQHRFRTTRDLRLSESVTGPPHAQSWTVVAFFRDVEYGRGEGLTKAAATELASKQALDALKQPGAGH